MTRNVICFAPTKATFDKISVFVKREKLASCLSRLTNTKTGVTRFKAMILKVRPKVHKIVQTYFVVAFTEELLNELLMLLLDVA